MEEKKLSLEEKIRKEASFNATKYNLRQYAKVRDIKVKHHEVCTELVKLADEYNYPICYLVYFAIGKNAHRTYVFEEGYKNIDIKKAKTILKWLKMFAKYNGNQKLFKNTDLSHFLTKYYEKVGKTNVSFKEFLEKYPKNPFIHNFKYLETMLKLAETNRL